MERRQELIKIFSELDKNILVVATPLIDRLLFIEEQLVNLEGKPLIKFHPEDAGRQKSLPAGKLYNQLLAQQKDIVRMLAGLLQKTSNTEVESKLDAWLARELKP